MWSPSSRHVLNELSLRSSDAQKSKIKVRSGVAQLASSKLLVFGVPTFDGYAYARVLETFLLVMIFSTA